MLRPITEAMVNTTAEAIGPALADLRDRFLGKIRPADEVANPRLDEELSRKIEHEV